MSDGMDYGQSERSMWFAEIAALRADLAKAREEWQAWKEGAQQAAKFRDSFESRALAAERARDEALAQVDRIQAQAAGEKDRNYARLYQYRALIVRAAEALSNGVDPVEGSLNPLEALRFELEAALGSHWCTQRQVQAPGAMEECRVCQPPLLPSPYFARALAAERARDEAVAEVKFYQDREAYYAKLLNVTDGGRYRADWAGAVDRLKLARDEAVAEIAERAETEKSLTAMVVEVQSERDEAVAALRDLLDCIECIPPNTRAIARARRALGRTDGEG